MRDFALKRFEENKQVNEAQLYIVTHKEEADAFAYFIAQTKPEFYELAV